MESKFFILKDELPIEELGDGVSRQIMGYNEQIMTVKVLFEAGAVGSLHTHPHHQTTYCAGGAFEFSIGGKTVLLREGDGAFIPPGVLHGVLCKEKGVLIDTFHPVREDFLS
ncbi:MAG: cupin domain-containing protein [Marinilabiliales bacterium]|nr:cupin domain-containing protein [Marinilabiliales bacterium]